MRLAFSLAVLATAAITSLTGVATTTAALASPRPEAHLGGAAAPKAGPGTQPPGGTTLWTARYEAPANYQLQAAGLGVSPDGSTVFVTGSASSGGSPDQHIVTVAYNAATGARIWVARYYVPGGSSDAASLAVSPDGSTVFVTGGAGATSGAGGYVTMAYNAATGATLWVRRYDPPGDDGAAHAVVVSPDGSRVFVTGGIGAESTDLTNFVTVAYDAATGTSLWVQHYVGPGDAGGGAVAAGMSPDGSILFVAGVADYSDGQTQFATLAYATATGALQWVAPYNVFGTADSIAVSPDGARVYVTGSDRTAAYDAATGASVWVADYGNGRRAGLATSVAVSPDGAAVFVTGSSITGKVDMGAYATVAYDAATGTTLWTQLYPGRSGSTRGASVAVSPDGTKVFVTGGDETAAGNTSYATLAYNVSTGTRLWARKYSGPLSAPDSEAASVQVSPDGSKVFVTGFSVGLNDTEDYATVAYSP
jgi:DNA-binding beta-propeller fold protein YncE